MATTSRSTVKEDVQYLRDEKRQRARDEVRRKNPGIRDIIVEFQPDAVEIEQKSIPGGARWTLYTIFALMAAVCLWAYWAEVDRIVTAPGKLVIDEAIVIQPASTAPVHSINTQFGQIVKANQVLATLDPVFSEADVNQLQVKLESLRAKYSRFEAENSGNPFSITGHEDNQTWLTQLNAHQQRQLEYKAKISEFESELQKLNVQKANNVIAITTQSATLEVLSQLLEKYESLESKRSISPIELWDKELQHKKTQSEIEMLYGKNREVDAEINALADRKNAYAAGWKSEIAKMMADTYQEISENEQLLNKAIHANNFVEIRVPDDLPFKEFYVLEVAERTVGSVVQPGEALFKLMPIGAKVEVEVKLPDKDIGFVEIGDDVRIKLSSLPYQRYGYLLGKVRTISEDSFEKETGMGLPPQLSYIVRVEITDHSMLTNKPHSFKLRPGLVADTEIKVGKRPVYEYFLYPILRSLDSSIREAQ